VVSNPPLGAIARQQVREIRRIQCEVEHCTTNRKTSRWCNSHHGLNDTYGTPTPMKVCALCGTQYMILGNRESHKFSCQHCLPTWNAFTASERHRCWQHHITIPNFLWLLETQARHCATCDNPSRLELDHDNKCCPRHQGSSTFCGKCVRGLLCMPCNRMLAYYETHPGNLSVPVFDTYLAKGYIEFGEMYAVG